MLGARRMAAPQPTTRPDEQRDEGRRTRMTPLSRQPNPARPARLRHACLPPQLDRLPRRSADRRRGHRCAARRGGPGRRLRRRRSPRPRPREALPDEIARPRSHGTAIVVTLLSWERASEAPSICGASASQHRRRLKAPHGATSRRRPLAPALRRTEAPHRAAAALTATSSPASPRKRAAPAGPPSPRRRPPRPVAAGACRGPRARRPRPARQRSRAYGRR